MVKRVVFAMAMAALVLGGSAASAKVEAGPKCKDVKGKAAALKGFALMKAFGKNMKTPNPDKLASEISKAQSNFTKLFTKTEASNGCGTTGDAGDVELAVDDCVRGLLSLIGGVTTSSTTTTTLQVICGNDVVQAGEECDDGNLIDGDGCDSNCTPTGCGNSVVTAGEECDPPASIAGCSGWEVCVADCTCQVPSCPVNVAGGPNLAGFMVAEGADLDVGWTGVAHNQGFVLGTRLFGCLEDCDLDTNPVCTGTGPVGEGSINGSTLGPPVPLLAARVATCVINSCSEDITIHKLNLQTGEFEMGVRLNSVVYLTGVTQHPCPTCGGGTIGATGICEGGPRSGSPCTTEGTTANFGNTSSDCTPNELNNVGDLDIILDPISSGTVTLTADTPCTGGLCPCPGGGNPPKMNDCDVPDSCSLQFCLDNGGSDEVRSGIKPGVDQACCRRGTEIIPCFIVTWRHEVLWRSQLPQLTG